MTGTQRQNALLYMYIWSIGECYGYGREDSLTILNCTGPNAGKQQFYRCFVKGGIQFEISYEYDEEATGNQWTYEFRVIWEGPFRELSSTDVLALLMIYGHGPFHMAGGI